MSLSWVNVDWFKRKILHEYQSGGDEATKKYLEVISQAISDTDYVELLEYANGLTPEDTNPDKSEEDRLWRI
jgi:hypothetical protein